MGHFFDLLDRLITTGVMIEYILGEGYDFHMRWDASAERFLASARLESASGEESGRYAEPPSWATVESGESAGNLRSTKASPKPLTLNPWRYENHLQHRALLLLAMQDPHSNRADGPRSHGTCDGRSLEAVVKALANEVSRRAVRAWFSRKGWAGRIGAHGAEAQLYAAVLYRKMYLSRHGQSDMRALAPLISVPVPRVFIAHGDTAEDAALELVNLISLQRQGWLSFEAAQPLKTMAHEIWADGKCATYWRPCALFDQ